MKTEILSILRQTKGYVSGQELCERLGVSRTAVWKCIKKLQEEGYEIQGINRKGYRLVAAGWHCRFGEIDLICEKENFLCFVEVKLRRSERFGTPGAFVDAHKQERLRISARLYLAEHITNLQPRFDVVEILAPQGMDTKAPIVRHIENAF